MRHKKHKSRISSAVKKRVCAALLVGVMGITMVAGASYVPSVYAKTDAEIKRVWVEPEYRGRHIAAELMRMLEERIAVQGFERAILQNSRSG